MSGGITYDGIPVENGGQIFEGLKFWVAQRVPTRNTILEHIRNNSGVVVALEKDADYLIADHARKDAPSGALSWKFVTESVQNGFVQVPDRYKIGHAPAGPRQASSGRPTKGTRAKFTDEEDAALAQWVLSHDKDRTGNIIYMEFETMYPSHPWQSWRNRFAKKLMLLPPESLQQLASRAGERPTTEDAEEAQRDRELPDPTELMLQRRGQRVQQEAAAQRAQSRAAQAPRAKEQRPAPQPARQQDDGQEDAAETEAKNAFYEDLQMFSEERGFEIAPTQQVAGQPVELWELSKVVSEQRLPAEEIDWLRVAEDIGYTWVDMNAAVRSLQHCYEENLAEFLEVMQDTLDADDELGADEELDAAEELAASRAAQQAAFDRIASSRAPLPSSPPERFLPAKRALDPDGEIIIPTPAKRRRLHIPPEVPSTPDTERFQHQPLSNTSRRLSVAATPVQFETQPPPLQTHESSFDITPSQQLQSEHINTSPIPLRLDTAAKNRQVGTGAAAAAAAAASSSSKQSNRGVKRRVLPRDFQPPPPPIEEESSLFVPDDEDQVPEESQFSGALPDPHPPRPPVGRPAQVVAATRRVSKEEELGNLIQHYESLGYAHKTVVEGLRRTTMTPGLATVVMQSLHEGRGVPSHHEGIWTDRDDEGLRLVHSLAAADLDADVPRENKEEMKKIRKARRTRTRLLDKHGQDRMTLRMKYLRANDSLAAAAAAEEQSA